MSKRPPISESIKRQVRQRCGFGCIICGCPIYDYDHIEEWASVKEHEVENLVLLCPTCHRKKTNGQITTDLIRRRLNTQSRKNTSPESIPFMTGNVWLGTNYVTVYGYVETLVHEGQVVGYDAYPGYIFINQDTDFFSLVPNVVTDEGGFFLNVALFDDEGDMVFEVVLNEYRIHKTNCVWDVKWKKQAVELIFFNHDKKRFYSLKFDAANKSVHFNGKIKIKEGVYLEIDKGGISCGNLHFAGNQILNSRIALLVDSHEGLKSNLSASEPSICFYNSGWSSFYSRFSNYDIAICFSTEHLSQISSIK